ncbi:MAG: efflux RND transporter permease subunit [Sumerlaeia bacterium]
MQGASLPVRRPVLSLVAGLLLIVLGVAALLRLPVRQYPDIDPPIVTVQTFYRGAAASVMDAEITERLEEVISGIRGVDVIESTSRNEVSSIRIQFQTSRDIDLAAVDVRESVNQVINELPDRAERPIVEKADTGGGSAMMWITLTSDKRSPLELTDFAERNLVDPLSIVNGVARVLVGGERRYAMRVFLDREAMAARDVTVSDVTDALRRENVELPAGRIEGGTRETVVRATTRFARPEEFRSMVVRDAGDEQGRVLLEDVAEVRIGPANVRSLVLENRKEAIGLGIIRQTDANTLTVAQNVRDQLDQLRATVPPDIAFSVSYDQSLYIEESIRQVLLTMAIALGLVIAVIFFVLGSFRATIIPAITIPVSILATFSVLFVLGFSINVLTLLAVILAIGLVVDDAIVVIENIYRRLEMGEPRLLATVNGVREVGFAVIATTAVLVAVFVPISFQSGRIGRLFTEFGLTLAFAVIFSSFVALTLTPTLCSKILRADKLKNFVGRWVDKGFQVLERFYSALLGLILKAAWLAPLVILGGFAAVYFLYRAVPQELAPTEDRGTFYVVIEGPQGNTLASTREVVEQVLAILAPYGTNDFARGRGGDFESGEAAAQEDPGNGKDQPPRIIDRVISILAPGGAQSTPVNEAFLIVKLVPWGERDMSQMELVERLRPQLMGLPGAQVIPVNPPGFNLRGTNQPVQFVVQGPNYDTVKDWGEQVLNAARQIPAIQNPRMNLESTKPQLEVTVNRELAADLGIDARTIGETLGTLFGTREVTDYVDRNELYDVIVEARPSDKNAPEDLRNVFVRVPETGRLIPLASLVETRLIGAPQAYRGVNKLSAATITASLAEGTSLGNALNRLESRAEELLPEQARFTYLGQAREYRESAQRIYYVFAFALVLAYLVLAAQFESFLDPLTILSAVPLALVGALGALLIFGGTLNVYSQIALVMLIGLMAKNSILVVEFANQLRNRESSLRDATREAAKVRLRPVLMTSASTLLGALPLVLASGAGAEGRQAIGLVIISGIVVATLMTLFLVPPLYLVLGRFTKPRAEQERELARQREEAEKSEEQNPE